MYRRLVFSSPFINLFSHLFTYISMDLWIIFYTLDYNPVLCYLFGCLDHPALVTDFMKRPFGSCAPLTPPPPLFCLQSTFLLSATIRCSRLILYITCSSRRISHCSKEPRFLSLENGVRYQDWYLTGVPQVNLMTRPPGLQPACPPWHTHCFVPVDYCFNKLRD